MRAVLFEGLTKYYGKKKALNNITFEVPEESVTALIGPNGAGKTTVLKLIAGLINGEGEISIFDQSKKDWNTQKLMNNIFFVPEEKALDISKKVARFITEIDHINDRHSGIDFQQLTLLMREFRLDPKRDEAIRELSLGMRTALYLSVALSSSAKLQILDEPLSGLDPIIRERVIGKLKEMIFEGKTIFYSSHIIEEVEEVADRVIIINQGRILFSGVIDDAKDQYSEYILENPDNLEKYKSMPGVLYIKQNARGMVNLFVDNYRLRDSIPAKKFNLKLKEIFRFLIEMDDMNYV